MNTPKKNSIYFYQKFINDSDNVSEFKIIQLKGFNTDDNTFVFIDVKTPKNTVEISENVFNNMISKDGHKIKTSRTSHIKTFLSLYNSKL